MESGSKPRRRRLRRVVRAGLASGLGLMCLFAAGLFPQAPLRRVLERQLQSRLGPGCHVGSLHIVPALLEVRAADVRIETADASLWLASGRLDLSWASVLRRELAVQHIELDRPRLTLKLSGRVTSKPLAFTRPVEIEQLRIGDGEIAVVRAGQTVAQLAGIEASGSVGRGALEIRTGAGRLANTDLLGALAQLRVSPALDLAVERLEVQSARSRLDVTGSIARLLDHPRANLRLTCDLALEDLETGPETPLAGRLRAEGTLVGTGPDDLHADASLSAEKLSLAQVEIERLKGRVRHAPRSGTEIHARAGLLGGPASLEAHLLSSRVDARLAFDNLALERLPSALLPAGRPSESRLVGSLEAHGPLERPQVTAHATGEVSWPAASSVALTLDAEGSVRPRVRSVDLTWTAEAAFDRATVREASLRDARLTLKGTTAGAWPPKTEADATGAARLVTAAGESPATLAGHLLVSRDGASGQGTVALGSGRLVAQAQLSPSSVRRLEVRATDLDLSLIAPDLAGRLGLQLTASGPLARLKHQGQVEGRGLVWRGIALGDAQLDDQGEGRQGRLKLTIPALRLTASASIDRGAPHVARVAADLAGTPLEPFATLVGRPLNGRLAGHVEAQVPLAHPRSATASVRLESGEAASGALSASLTQPLIARIAQSQIAVESLSLALPGGTLSASGRLGWSGAQPIDAHAAFQVDLAKAPAVEGWTKAGRVEGEVDFKGSPQRPDVTGQVRLAQVSLAREPWPAALIPDGTVVFAGDRAQIAKPIEVQVAEGRIEIQGEAPLAALGIRLWPAEKNAPGLALDVRWQDLSPETWLAAWRPGPGREAIAGAFSGHAHVGGSLASLDQLRVDADLDASSFATRQASVDLEPARLTLMGGRLATERLRLQSSAGTLELSGNLDLVHRQIALDSQGTADLEAFAPLLRSVGLSGTAEGRLNAAGRLSSPALSGDLQLKGVTLRSREFAQPISDLDAHLIFGESQVRVVSLSAQLGGGALSLAEEGTARLAGARVTDLDLHVKGQEVSLQYPSGLRSQLDADLKLTGQSGAFLLSGSLHALSANYTQDLATEKTLLAPLPPVTVSPALRAVRLKLEILADNPIRVRNDVADLQATGGLELRGDLETPQPFGRLDVLTPGGRLFLQGREITVERGSMTYEGSWQPTLSLTGTMPLQYVEAEAQGAAGSSLLSGQTRTTTVTAEANGTATEIMNAWAARMAGNSDPSLDRTLRLTSTAGLSEADLASLLATGRRSNQLGGQEARSLGEQAASLVAARLATGAFKGLGGLGLDEVRFEPQVIGREGNPSARFTFGKRLTPWARLVYSRALDNPEESFFDLKVEPGWRTTLTLERQDTGLFVYGAGQRLNLGGRQAGKRGQSHPERTRVKKVVFEGAPEIPETELADLVKTRSGELAAPWDVQDDADRLRRILVKRRYLTADVSAGLKDGVATFRVNTGPLYQVEIQGMNKPPDLLPVLEQALYEQEAGERGTARLLETLRSRGHLTAAVDFKVVRTSAGHTGVAPRRTLLFQVEPGPRYSSAGVTFPGARALSAPALRKASGGPGELIVDADESMKRIEALYRAHYFLAARVGPVHIETHGSRVGIEVPIDEGSPARIAALSFVGVSLPPETLAEASKLTIGERYDDARLLDALVRVRNHYWSLGMDNARVTPRLEPQGADVGVVFEIEEGQRASIAGFEIQGVTGHLAERVRHRIDVKAGAPLDPRTLSKLERRLLDVPGVANVRATPKAADPSTVVLEVEPAPWARTGYDIRYDRQNHISGLVDGELATVDGLGTVGARLQQSSRSHEARGSLHSMLFGGRGLTGSVFQLSEDLTSNITNDQGKTVSVTVRQDQTGAEVQQAFQLPDRWLLLGGYRYARVRTAGVASGNVGALELSTVRESRDNPLDARRGRFLSLNLELSLPELASSNSFIKGFAQALVTRSLSQHVIWAQGYRLGLAHVFSGALPSTEAFTAGGPNTVRGFKIDSIGPRVIGQPTAGGAVFVLNQELRYRHKSGVGLAVFMDAGNVFATAGDMRLSARESLGTGLRWASPLGLLRLDFAWPIRPRPGEPRHLMMFSIGQAF